MQRFKRFLVGAAALAVGTLVVASAVAAGGNTIVKVGPSSLGPVLVDAHGKTLYIWAHDKTSKSTCNGACAEYWPPLITQGRPKAIAGAKSRLISTSRRSDGRMQVTYAGHPLYSFALDTKAGQTTGEGLTDFGGRWDPVSSTGKAVRKGGGMRRLVASDLGESTLTTEGGSP